MSATLTSIHEAELVRPRLAARAVPLTARLSLVGVPLILIAAPLWFGATTQTASVVLVAASWLLFLLWLAGCILEQKLPLTSHPVLLPAALLLAFTSVHWAMGLSASVPTTQMEWLRWTGYLALALVAAETFSTPERLRWLLGTLAAAGAAIAVLGIAQHLTGEGRIYWLIEPSQGGWVFGPYVNRNHYAGLMELWIPLALGMALAPDVSFLRRWLWCGAALVMAASVVMAASRGGLLAVAVQVVVLVIATAALHGRRRAVVGLLAGVVLLAGFLWYVGSADLLERFTQIGNPGSATVEEVSGHRFEAWVGSLQIFRQHWLLGTGLDTFEPHFRAVRQYYTDKVWTHAHNDFLQFVAETGVIGVALGLWLVIAAAREIVRNLRRTTQTATGTMLIGLGCACLGFMVHGWLDFNFHVPANAAGFAVLAAIAARRGWDED